MSTEYPLYGRDEPALSGVERDLYEAVSREEPWALVERFAELERVSGSADERRAAEYLTDRLADLGIDHDRHDPELRLSVPKGADLAATAPVEESFDAVKTVSFSADGGVEAEAVYLGGGDAESVDDVLTGGLGRVDVDVGGRVVVMEGLLPIGAIADLESMGAVGFVGVHEHEREPHEGIASPVWGGVPDPDRTDRVPDIPIVNVTRPVGDRLIELAGEGLELAVSADVTTDWFDCPVVVAEVEGAGPSDDFVLLHAHYDSWHVGVTDNATGDAGLLELARVFEEHADELRRDLRVAWWPGHSTGRYAGSTWFVDEFAIDLVENCVAQVNMDSPGVADATEFTDMVEWMPEADSLCRGAIDDAAGKPAEGGRPARAGDYSFNNLGITGLYMLFSNIPGEVREERGYHPVGGCGGNSDAWHLSTDTIDKADPEVLVRDIRVYAVTLARLLCEEVLPLDHRDTVARHREIVGGYQEASPFDLSPVVAELEELEAAVEAFYGAVEAGEVAPDEANEAIKRLSRRLVRVNFASEGRFEQDPAVGRPPYPALAPATDLPETDGDDRRFRERALVRARNRVVNDLRTARRALPVGGGRR